MAPKRAQGKAKGKAKASAKITVMGVLLAAWDTQARSVKNIFEPTSHQPRAHIHIGLDLFDEMVSQGGHKHKIQDRGAALETDALRECRW